MLDAPVATIGSEDEHGGEEQTGEQRDPPPCPSCGGRMRVTESFDGPMSRPYHIRRLDTS